jgi:hypothetical protein
MTKISYQSKDGRLAGVATFYSEPVGGEWRGSVYASKCFTDEEKQKIAKKAAQFHKLLNSKKLNLITL